MEIKKNKYNCGDKVFLTKIYEWDLDLVNKFNNEFIIVGCDYNKIGIGYSLKPINCETIRKLDYCEKHIRLLKNKKRYTTILKKLEQLK